MKKNTFKNIFFVFLGLLFLSILWEYLFSFYARERFLVKKDQYQAIFLTNGQSYFGKIDNITQEFYVLKDIYYFRYGDIKQVDEEKTLKTDLSLIKLGEELHGPEDMMVIKRDQVLFWENLKNDSKVVKAIQADKRK